MKSEVEYANPASGASVEGTAVKSTAASANLVLTAQGDGTSAWASVAGTGDVVGPAASVDSEIAIFSGTSGKLLKRLTGSGVVKATSGVASVATLVNADVSASAAIAYSKLAALADGNILVGSGANVATSVALSGEATIVNTGAITLSNAAVIAKVLTGYSSGAGTVASTDSILQAVQKLNGNIALKAPSTAPTFATSITGSYLTASVPLVTDASKNIVSMSYATFLGNLSNFVGDSGSGGTKGLVPAPASGDAAAAKFLKADGTWAVPAGGGGTKCTVTGHISGTTITNGGYTVLAYTVDTDNLSAYSGSTFTVPTGHGGLYGLWVSALAGSYNWAVGDYFQTEIKVNGVSEVAIIGKIPEIAATIVGGYVGPMGASITWPLSDGDTVQIEVKAGRAGGNFNLHTAAYNFMTIREL